MGERDHNPLLAYLLYPSSPIISPSLLLMILALRLQGDAGEKYSGPVELFLERTAHPRQTKRGVDVCWTSSQDIQPCLSASEDVIPCVFLYLCWHILVACQFVRARRPNPASSAQAHLATRSPCCRMSSQEKTTPMEERGPRSSIPRRGARQCANETMRKRTG